MRALKFVTACALSSAALTAQAGRCPGFHRRIDRPGHSVEPDAAGDRSHARRTAGHHSSDPELCHASRGDL